MSTYDDTIDPELMGLLSELAEQEERTLLSASMVKLRKTWGAAVDRVSVRMNLVLPIVNACAIGASDPSRANS